MYAEVYILCQQREGMAEIVHILIYHQMAAPEEGREKRHVHKDTGGVGKNRQRTPGVTSF